MKKILVNKNFQILLLIFLFLITALVTQASTSGNAGIFQTLVNFLKNMNDGLKIVFTLGGMACLGFGLFKMVTDPNMGAIITFLIGVAITLSMIFGSETVVTGLGGTMINFNSLGGF